MTVPRAKEHGCGVIVQEKRKTGRAIISALRGSWSVPEGGGAGHVGSKDLLAREDDPALQMLGNAAVKRLGDVRVVIWHCHLQFRGDVDQR